MNHAVGWRTPRARASSMLLMPFLAFATHQMATNHFCSGSGLSSKIVSTLTENCFRQSFALHCSIDRLVITPILSPLHFGQVILPSGHFTASIASKQTFALAKYSTAVSRVLGSSDSGLFVMVNLTKPPPGTTLSRTE